MFSIVEVVENVSFSESDGKTFPFMKVAEKYFPLLEWWKNVSLYESGRKMFPFVRVVEKHGAPVTLKVGCVRFKV